MGAAPYYRRFLQGRPPLLPPKRQEDDIVIGALHRGLTLTITLGDFPPLPSKKASHLTVYGIKWMSVTSVMIYCQRFHHHRTDGKNDKFRGKRRCVYGGVAVEYCTVARGFIFPPHLMVVVSTPMPDPNKYDDSLHTVVHPIATLDSTLYDCSTNPNFHGRPDSPPPSLFGFS